MNDAEITARKEKFVADIREIMRSVEEACPGAIGKDLARAIEEGGNKELLISVLKRAEHEAENSLEGMGTGAAAGAATSYVLLGVLGTSGFSAAGLTSGLAALGLGLGMTGGIFVIPAIIAAGAWWRRGSKKEKKIRKLQKALEAGVRRLYEMKIELSEHADSLENQLKVITVLLAAFETMLNGIDEKLNR